MNNPLKKEILWLRSCFRGYDVDEGGLEVIAKFILKQKEEIEDLKSELRKLRD
jgi:hypothetical protein